MVTTKKRQHPPTAIGHVLNKYAISLQQLKDCLEGEGVEFSSRSTLHRMVVGHEFSDEMKEKLYPATARCLSKFLVARGLDKSEIDAELTAIFTKGEYQPMITQRIELPRDVREYFGLEKDPFTQFPEQRADVFIAPAFQKVVDRVYDALQYPVFLAVTGDIGSGKDVLRGLTMDHVATHRHLQVVWPEFPNQGRIAETHIARAILRHFNYDQPRGIEDVAHQVKICLENEFKSGNRITLAFNECHHLNKTALSSLKNFFEMGSGGFQRWLSVLLIGQPKFAETVYNDKGQKIGMRGTLFSPEFRELYERIVLMEMPTGSEFHKFAADYMRFRLKRANAPEGLFDDEAIDYIARNSKTPQQLGNIANEALRVSKEDLDNDKVIGAAIATIMHFASPVDQKFMRRSA